MPRKHYQPEEVIKLLRLVEIEVGQGKTTGQACKQLGFTEQSYYRWRKEYGGLQINQAKRLKELEKENNRLKKLVADLSLDKDILNEALRGNYQAPSGAGNVYDMYASSLGYRNAVPAGSWDSPAAPNVVSV